MAYMRFPLKTHLLQGTLKPFPFLQLRFNSTAITYSMLRPYQKECINMTLEELEKGARKQVVSLPVGSGKTVIMSNLIPILPCPTPTATKVLLLAHRAELLDQAHNQITKYNPELVVHVEQGKRLANIEEADVIVASVPTLGRANSKKISNYDPSLFKAILIDEAHHAVASTYMNILNHFKVDDPDSKILVWGCSATVKRHDGLSLRDVFDKITYHVDFLQMIREGYLCQMKVTMVHTNIDLDGVGRNKNDFKLEELSNAINIDSRNEVIISSWRKFAHDNGRKSTLVFAADIAHTVDLCNAFLDAGINAAFITSTTPALTRYQILNDFRSGKIAVLVNCAILTEGTDIPCIDCILLARPTRSNTLFQQMFGRGLRLFPGKEDCLLLDFVDNFQRSGNDGLMTMPTLFGLSAKEMVTDTDIIAIEKKAQDIREELRQTAEREKAEEEERELEEEQAMDRESSNVRIKFTEYDSINELVTDLSGPKLVKSISKNGWVKVGPDQYILRVPTKGFLMLKRKKGMWSGFFRYDTLEFRAQPFSIPLQSDDLINAIQAADTYVQQKFGNMDGIQYQISRYARYRKDDVTEAQRRALERYKIETPENMTKGQAMDLLTKLKFGQLKIWKTQLKADAVKQKLEEKRIRTADLVVERLVPTIS